MDKEYLRLQEKGHVKFKFMSRPEFLKDGSTILFREGKTQGFGYVTRLIPLEDKPETVNQQVPKTRQGKK